MLLYQVIQQYTERGIPIYPETSYLKGIKSDLMSAVSSLVGPGSTVRIQGRMPPLHVQMKYLETRDLMLSMNLDDKARKEINIAFLAYRQHSHSEASAGYTFSGIV